MHSLLQATDLLEIIPKMSKNLLKYSSKIDNVVMLGAHINLKRIKYFLCQIETDQVALENFRGTTCIFY